MFKHQTRLMSITLDYFYDIMTPSLGKASSHMISCIPITTHKTIIVSLSSNTNTLERCDEVYGVSKNIFYIIAKELCATIIKHLKPFGD